MPATKPRAYQVYDIDWKQAVRALSDTNINLASPGALVIDTVVLDPYDRVLLTAQTDATENGIYQVNAAQTLLVPAPDWVNINSGLSSAVNSGLTVSVTDGAEYAQTTWTLTTSNPIVIGVTAIVFEQVPEASDRIGNIYFDGSIIELANSVPETDISILPSGAGSDVGMVIPNDTTANIDDLHIFNLATNGNVKISTAGGDWRYDTAGNFTGNGNVQAGYFLGNGALLTGISTYSNNNVANYLPTYAGNLGVSNINFVSNSRIHSGVQHLFIEGTVGGVVEITTDNGNYTWGFDDQGELILPMALNGTSPLSNSALLYTPDNLAIKSGDDILIVPDNNFLIYAAFDGNINDYSEKWEFANNEIKNISGATGVVAEIGNLNLQGGRNTIGNGNVTITAVKNGAAVNVWTFDNTGNLSAPGNISANYFIGNGALLTGISAGSSYSNANAAAYAESGWAGNIIPAANAVYSLGNVTNQWGNLWVANNTIYLGNVPLAIGAGNVLTVDGNAVLQNGSNSTISTTGNISANYFIGNGSQLTGLSATYGNANVADYLAAYGSNTIVTTGNITAGNIGITGGSLEWSNASIVQTSASDVSITGDGQVTVRSLSGTYQWTFDSNGNLTLPGSIIGASTIELDNRAYGNSADINLYAADDIVLQARDRTAGSTTEGGDINIYAGDSAEDGDSSGGDIQIRAGDGGAANVDYGGSGGFITIRSGQGGAAIGNSGYTAESGGALTLSAGDAGSNNGNIDLGAAGGDVYIGAGDSTGNTVDGGGIYITSGAAGTNALAGQIQLTIPPSDSGSGGVWIFDGYGNLRVPGNINLSNGISILDGYATVSSQYLSNATSQSYNDFVTGNYYNASTLDIDYTAYTGASLLNFDIAYQAPLTANIGISVGAVNAPLIQANANIVLTANSGTAQTWTFGTDGRLTFPGTPRIDTDSNNFEVQAAESISLEANAVVNIYTDSSGNAYQWQFGDDGNFTAPGNVSASGNITGNYFIGDGSQLTNLPSGGGNTGNVTFNDVNIIGTGNLKLQPDLADAGAYLDIYLTAGPDIHIAGNGETVILGTDDFANVTVNVDGNVSIQANNGTPHTWTFDTAGSLNLPGNTIAINYLNGNPAFGTVTFNNEAVIGTGTSNTVSGLYLAPDPVSLANDLYLRVRGNIQDEPTHIHFDTGNNQYYNQFIGDDNKYIQLANTGNIVINTNDNVGNTAQWNFDTTGNLTLPGNTFAVNYANGSPVPIGGGGGNTGNVTFDDQVIQGTGDQEGGSGLYLAPGTASTGNLQYLRVRGGDFPTHIHLDTGNNAYFDQYFGDDNKYVKLEANGNIILSAYDGANTHAWTFGSAGAYGELVLPTGEGIIKVVDDSLSLVSLNTTTGNANSVYLGSGGGLGFNDQEIGGNWLEIFRSGTEPEIRVPVGRGNLNIQTAEGANVYNWLFDNTGNLTLPTDGYLVVTTGIIGSGASPAPSLSGFSSIATTGSPGNISASGNLIANVGITTVGNVTGNYFIGNGSQLTGLSANYGNSNVANFLAAYGSNTIVTTGNITAGNLIGNISITGNVTGTSANVTLVAGAYSTVFDNIGTATLPGALQLAVYANTTVRDTAIPSPTPGMMIYVTGTGMQVRGATGWNTIAGSGT